MAEFAISTDEAGSIHISGAIGPDAEPEFSLALSRSDAVPLVLDLAGLTAIDDVAIRLIVRRLGKGPVTLVHTPEFAMQALSAARVLDLPGVVALSSDDHP